MSATHVVLHARFDPVSVVKLVKVSGERTLRAEGGEAIDRQRADKQGTVIFASGVESDARFIAVGSGTAIRSR